MRSLLGGLVLGCVVLSGPMALAHPAGLLPEVSLGSTPNRTFAGVMGAPGTIDLLTISDGQEFIVTAFVSSVSGGGGWSGGGGFELLADGVSVLGGQMIDSSSYSAFGQNEGQLKVDTGQTLRLQYTGSSTDASYYIQGRFVAEGSPYHSVNGTLSESDMSPGPYTIFSADSGRDFIVRTLAIYCAGGPPDVVIDGSLAVPRQVGATVISPSRTLLATGRGSLLVSGGRSLGLQGTSTSNCDYYMDGLYTLP
jgi:hypothetical protein